jgi:hypothetical protein
MLPCGHLCEQKCSTECFCEKKCENICPHGHCGYNCLEACVDCEEKCEIGCKHNKCKKKCGELCERKPCDKRCEKRMKCGHQCYGLCGERCPKVCRICNPEEECFTEDFFYMCEIDEDALVYKTKCGHIFSVSALDNYFNTWGKIQMIKCPKCTQNLIYEPRYQNYIKNIFIDIQKIKKIYLKRNFVSKDGETFYKKSSKIVERILEQYGEIEEKQKEIKNNRLANYKNKKQYINVFELFNDENNFWAKIEYNNHNLEKKINTIYDLCKSYKNEKNNKIKKIGTYNLLTLAEKLWELNTMYILLNPKKKKKKKCCFSIIII